MVRHAPVMATVLVGDAVGYPTTLIHLLGNDDDDDGDGTKPEQILPKPENERNYNEVLYYCSSSVEYLRSLD